MTETTFSPISARAPRRLADRIRNAQRQASGRVHAAADADARSQGWAVTESTSRLGMGGRTYRDLRFSARRQPVAATHDLEEVTRDGR